MSLPYENDYAFGVDVSFVKQCVDQGKQYKDANEVKAPLQIFRDHGYNWGRVHLCNEPVRRLPQTLEYVVGSGQAIKRHNMRFLLDLMFSNGWANPITQGFFDKMKEYHVEYDVIGLSFYPWSHGTLLDLRDNLKFTALRYGKEIIVVETGYYFQPSRYFRDLGPPFPETADGQRQWLEAVNEIVLDTPNGLGKGIFWWEPMMAGRGYFDRDGRVLPIIHVFEKYTLPMRWPGTLQPAAVDKLAAHIDVFPTLAELAGAKLTDAVKQQVEGRSLAPLLKDANAFWPDRILVTHLGRWDRSKAAESKYRGCSVRNTRWHLVCVSRSGDKEWQLFDVKADPGEQHDVAAAHPDVVKELDAAYDKWWDSVQPQLVNENSVGPKVNPFKELYWKQYRGLP